MNSGRELLVEKVIQFKHAVTDVGEREWQITSAPEQPYNINASSVVASI